MKSLFDHISLQCSIITTKAYSTSFSLGIMLLDRSIRGPIYAIYGFVRCADEIVDSFHGYDKKALLDNFRRETYQAIDERISLNPILNAFQAVVHRYKIRRAWIDIFLDSMEMDLMKRVYNENSFREYILGSAEAVGLMCLHVFVDGDEEQFLRLQPHAMRLGAAFQKVNFLRDVKKDHEELGRMYFPGVDLRTFSVEQKQEIEWEIESDFTEALKGIRLLPPGSRNGVYVAYRYYLRLFRKIRRLPPHRILQGRIRIPNALKLMELCMSSLRHQFNLL
ncbi:MAG TPA: phytoene/squalene synthase family protein [Saprospiraceae bacterium]|nr:phytoene/squalene synthase family protein [Saprospiraceae bacterium]